MSHRPSISFNKPTIIPLKPTQLHNCQTRDIYIIQLFKESFWPSFCNEKCGLHARRTELPLTSAINMQKKIHGLPNISQAARVFVSYTISSLYQTTLTSKETRLCLSEGENLWMPSWRRSYLCNMTLQLVPISPAQSDFSTGYPSSKLCVNVQNKRFVKEKNNCFCSLRM